MPAIRTADSTAKAEAALGEVEAVPHEPADSIVRHPFDQGSVDAPLQYQVFNESPDRVVGQRGCDGGAQAEAAAQAPGHVVFAATLPNQKLTCRVYAALARIQTEHDFAQAEAVPAMGSIGDHDLTHLQRTLFQSPYRKLEEKSGANKG
jgi:hypothetical protein